VRLSRVHVRTSGPYTDFMLTIDEIRRRCPGLERFSDSDIEQIRALAKLALEQYTRSRSGSNKEIEGGSCKQASDRGTLGFDGETRR
jgi:hypothetical protein